MASNNPVRDDDHRKKAAAEIAQLHINDQKRLIEQMGPVIHEMMVPLQRRRVANHFHEEYEELYRRRSKS